MIYAPFSYIQTPLPTPSYVPGHKFSSIRSPRSNAWSCVDITRQRSYARALSQRLYYISQVCELQIASYHTSELRPPTPSHVPGHNGKSGLSHGPQNVPPTLQAEKSTMASAFGAPPGIVCGTVTSYGDATFISPSHSGPRVYSGFTLTALWIPVM